MLITTKTQTHGARKELQFYQVYGCSTAGVYAKGAGVYAKGAGVYAKGAGVYAKGFRYTQTCGVCAKSVIEFATNSVGQHSRIVVRGLMLFANNNGQFYLLKMVIFHGYVK